MNKVSFSAVEKSADPVPLSWQDISLCSFNVLGIASRTFAKFGYMSNILPPLGILSDTVAFGVESVSIMKEMRKSFNDLYKQNPLPKTHLNPNYLYNNCTAAVCAALRLALLLHPDLRKPKHMLVTTLLTAYSIYNTYLVASRAISEIGKSLHYAKAGKSEHNLMLARNLSVHGINALCSGHRVWSVFDCLLDQLGVKPKVQVSNCDIIEKVNGLKDSSESKQQKEIEKLVEESQGDWRQFAKVLHPDKNPSCKDKATAAISLFNNLRKPTQKSAEEIDWSTFWGEAERVSKIPYPDPNSPHLEEERKRFGCAVLSPEFCEKMETNIQRAKAQMQEVLNFCTLNEKDGTSECPESVQESVNQILYNEIGEPISDQQAAKAVNVAYDYRWLDPLYEFLGYPSRTEVRQAALDRVNAAANNALRGVMSREAAPSSDCRLHRIRCTYSP